MTAHKKKGICEPAEEDYLQDALPRLHAFFNRVDTRSVLRIQDLKVNEMSDTRQGYITKRFGRQEPIATETVYTVLTLTAPLLKPMAT